ncbi:MAG: hypothetical protein AAF733_05585 [Verrucomicrobiota bacterium]
MRRNWQAIGFGAVFAFFLQGLLASAAERQDWDQEKAEAKVREVLAVEATGKLPWDDIAWETDPDAAVRRAQEEGKPLFLFLFLKKDVGPPEAPC